MIYFFKASVYSECGSFECHWLFNRDWFGVCTQNCELQIKIWLFNIEYLKTCVICQTYRDWFLCMLGKQIWCVIFVGCEVINSSQLQSINQCLWRDRALSTLSISMEIWPIHHLIFTDMGYIQRIYTHKYILSIWLLCYVNAAIAALYTTYIHVCAHK